MLVGFLIAMARPTTDNVSRWRRAWKNGCHHSRMLLRLTKGLLVTDHQMSVMHRLMELLSRLVWQLPQTIGGLLTAMTHVIFEIRGGVISVDYCRGATVVATRRNDWGAVSQGSIIVGCSVIEANEQNWLFRHEYGHYLQSQRMGWAYYSRVGIPSVLSRQFHNIQPVEQDANRRSALFFGTTQYNLLSVTSRWYDYVAWLLPLLGTVAVGLLHRNRDEKMIQ